jgi:hypothetical protein
VNPKSARHHKRFVEEEVMQNQLGAEGFRAQGGRPEPFGANRNPFHVFLNTALAILLPCFKQLRV